MLLGAIAQVLCGTRNITAKLCVHNKGYSVHTGQIFVPLLQIHSTAHQCNDD